LEDGRTIALICPNFRKDISNYAEKAFNILGKTFIAIINDLLVMVEYVKS